MNEKIKKKLLEALKAKGYSDDEAEAFINEVTSENEPVKDEIEEAKENIEEKGDDTQTEKDRVDESVGEQIEEKGEGDSQSAKDRVDESEGKEKAEEEKKDPSLSDMNEVEEPSEEKKEEPKTEPEIPAEPPKDYGKDIEDIRAGYEALKAENESMKNAIVELQKTVEKLSQRPVEVTGDKANKLEQARRLYQN